MNVQISDDIVITGSLPGPGISFIGVAQRSLPLDGVAKQSVTTEGRIHASIAVTGIAQREVAFDARWQFIEQEG